MGTHVYQTYSSEPGPWLLEHDALIELEEVTRKAWKAKVDADDASFERRIRKEVASVEEYRGETLSDEEATALRRQKKKDLAYLRTESKFEWQITLPGNKMITGESLEEVKRSNLLIGEAPQAFSLKAAAKGLSFEVELEADRGRLNVKVSPSRTDDAESLFIELTSWVQKWRQPLHFRVWRSYWGTAWIAWLLILWITAIFATSREKESSKAIRGEGIALLQQGITEANQAKAIELLLAHQTGYHPRSEIAAQSSSGSGLLKILFGGLAICIALSFPPKVAIGVGKGVVSLKRWRWWKTVVLITVPGFIFANLVFPAVVEAFK